MLSVNIIKKEHRNLAAVLYSIEQLVEEIEQGKQANLSVFHGLFTYIDRFLNRYHHPKENDFLFPLVLKRSADSKPLIEELDRQHKEGETLFIDMLKALSAFEFSGKNEFPLFRDAVHRYAEFENRHIDIEEQQLMPLAEACLTEDDWQQINEAFTANEDPMYGNHWSGEFSALFDKLIKELPAPLGLGEEWKPQS